jgi:hydroxyacylglutathione hydrolase
MFFTRFYEPNLAHASYMIGCQATGDALVIDAQRDIDGYLDRAKRERLRITGVAETHIHADFLCGSRELAAVTGAKLLLSDEGGPDWQYQFDHTPLRDGDIFNVGNLRVEVMHTPGHTPEHICFLVTDTAASDIPIMLFSGDFVFVGDVGRPDLLEKVVGASGTSDIGARQIWNSLERFKQLPDHVQVHPAHGAGSACGKALGAVPSSTVGYEKLVNWALRHTDEEAFVAELLSGQPEPPSYFAHMKRLNKTERPLQTEVHIPQRVSPDDIQEALDRGEWVVDTRHKSAFVNGHIPKSVNIQDIKLFTTWAGWMIPYSHPFWLVASDDRIDEIKRCLMRIGLDNAEGYLPGIETWKADGRALDIMPQMTSDELENVLNSDDLFVLDVRASSEFNGGHIPRAHHIHGGYLDEHLDDIPRSGTVVVACQGGDRSMVASSYLRKEGFTNIINFPPGFGGWKAAGKPVDHNVI